MKTEFFINNTNLTTIRRIYARECRNFQFDVPCSISVESYGLDGCEILLAVEKALEHIAWIPGVLEEQRVQNFDIPTNVAKMNNGVTVAYRYSKIVK